MAYGGFRHHGELTRTDLALEALLNCLEVKPDEEEVPLLQCIGRVLAEDIVSGGNIPPFDKSAVDGYALRSADTFGATPSSPRMLRIVGRIEIGEEPKLGVGELEAVKVATGSYLPRGSDAVVMMEQVKIHGEESIEIRNEVKAGQNVIRLGEDIERGEILIRRGTVLQPQDIGVIASLGLSQVKVFRKLKLAVLSTGSELIELGEGGHPAKTFDSNRYILASAVKSCGFDVVDMGIAADSLEDIRDRLRTALSEADAVLVTAGSSVGEWDLVPLAVESLGKPGILVHGISIKPGRPTGLAVVAGKPIFILPGFPTSTFVVFHAIVLPVIARMLGLRDEQPLQRKVRGRLTRRIEKVSGLKLAVGVRLSHEKGEVLVTPTGALKSSLLSPLSRLDGLVLIPEDRQAIEEGEYVEVLLLR